MCGSLDAKPAKGFWSQAQGDCRASMVDGPTKWAMLVTDMRLGRSIHVPAFFKLCGNQAKLIPWKLLSSGRGSDHTRRFPQVWT